MAASGPGHTRTWIPDLLTGSAIILAGVAACAWRPSSRVGSLLIVSGICWFAGNLAAPVTQATGLSSPSRAALAAILVASHRAPFAQALLAYPGGRLTATAERVGVVIVYASVVAAPILPSEAAALGVAVLIASSAFVAYRSTLGRERRAKLRAARLATGLAVAVVAGVVLRHVLGAGPGEEPAFVLYEIALGGSAVLLAAGLARTETDEAAVADMVVELGEVPSGTLRDALADLLGDPSLEVGYRVGTGDSFVDAAGRPFEVPGPSLRREVTRIVRDGEVVAVLVHDPAVLDDPALVDAVSSAARLVSQNVELQAEVLGQLAELRASRRRLVDAGEAEGRRLSERLNDGALHRLKGLGEDIGTAIAGLDPSLESGQRMARAQVQVASAVDELQTLSRGLHPRELQGGLAPALRALAEHSQVPMELAVPDVRLGSEIEAAVYFLCAEGLANVTKHAGASRVRVAVRPGEQAVTVELRDDGIGGADAQRGRGLRGLSDRIEALGGWLTVESPPTGGTRLTAELPIRRDGVSRP